mmetsp:Transcript_5588/g.19625  ORF Transcript_5588/g.19625 Transcript_5588/m.19625 type:complete len:100 (-) Transcript_5588:53-352(-)
MMSSNPSHRNISLIFANAVSTLLKLSPRSSFPSSKHLYAPSLLISSMECERSNAIFHASSSLYHVSALFLQENIMGENSHFTLSIAAAMSCAKLLSFLA